MAALFFIRDFAADTDPRYIVDSWQKSFLGVTKSNPRGRGPLAAMEWSTYFRAQKKVIDAILSHPDTLVKVAAWDDDPAMVLGWCCSCPARRLLHFLYVGGPYRQEGIGSALMRACFVELGERPIEATHWTGRLPFYRLRWKLEYNPFALYEVLCG